MNLLTLSIMQFLIRIMRFLHMVKIDFLKFLFFISEKKKTSLQNWQHLYTYIQTS